MVSLYMSMQNINSHGRNMNLPNPIHKWTLFELGLLFMIIAKAKRVGNISLFNCIGNSDGNNGIREIRTISPSNFPLKIVALKTFPVTIFDDQTLYSFNLGKILFSILFLLFFS
jgi:hypothetical protein